MVISLRKVFVLKSLQLASKVVQVQNSLWSVFCAGTIILHTKSLFYERLPYLQNFY